MRSLHARSRRALSLLAGLALASSHCRNAREGGGARDHASMSTLDASAAPARRIVSLVPSATEMLFALGAGDRVVGVSAYDDHPPEVTRLPRVGGMVNPSFEAIVALRPDAVVGVQGPLDVAVLERLERMGIRVFFPRVESVREVLASCDTFGELVGRRSEAHALRASLEAELARVRAAVSSRPKARVLAVFNDRPLSVAGPGSWVDEILAIAGGENVIREGGRYPTISVEQVITLAPDVILDMTWGDSALASSLARYSTVPAVRDRRVIRAGDPMLMRPWPRLGQAVARIAAMLHPEVRP